MKANQTGRSAADTIAHTFADKLAELLAPYPANWAELRERNATMSPGVCASHDYCDANMPMGEAFESVMGREPDPASDADAALWSAAWDIAKRDRLTAAPMDESRASEIQTWLDEPELLREPGAADPVFTNAEIAMARLICANISPATKGK